MPLGSTLGVMDIDDLFAGKPADPLTEVTKQDLGPLSIDELVARIETLKAEVARVETHMADAEREKVYSNDE